MMFECVCMSIVLQYHILFSHYMNLQICACLHIHTNSVCMVNFLTGLPQLSHSTSLLQLECAGEFVASLQHLNFFEVLGSNMLHLTMRNKGSRTYWDASYMLAHDWNQSVEGCCILKTRLCTSLTSLTSWRVQDTARHQLLTGSQLDSKCWRVLRSQDPILHVFWLACDRSRRKCRGCSETPAIDLQSIYFRWFLKNAFPRDICIPTAAVALSSRLELWIALLQAGSTELNEKALWQVQ